MEIKKCPFCGGTGEFTMDEKIEEMYQEFLAYKFNTKIDKFSYKGMCENFIAKGYRKESNTAREILGLILAKEFEKGDYLTDDELKKLVGEKYGVDLGE